MDEDKGFNAEQQSIVLSPNKVDAGKTDRDSVNMLLGNKVDGRFTVQHTFTTTGDEAINNPLGRIPKGVFVVAASKTMALAIDSTKFSVKRIYASSPSTGNIVTLLFL